MGKLYDGLAVWLRLFMFTFLCRNNSAKLTDSKEQTVKKEKPKKTLENIDFTNIASKLVIYILRSRH